MLALKVAFWICLILVFYTYLGYGILLWLILRIKRVFHPMKCDPVLPLDEEQLPTVTLMICAYNEEEVIPEKMENIRQLQYPASRLCVMWVTDGSTDRSNELLRQYEEVKLVFSPERKGKAAAMQHGLRENRSEIVVFTDANTMLNAEALREIVRQMMKPGVSCVSGEKRVAARHEGQVAAEGEGLYWKYESKLKQWDSDLYSAMGAAGELFAVRMEHYREAPSNALLDDFMMSMLIVKDGHRIAYTSRAYAMEYGSADMHEESKRKRRIAAGGLQSIWWLRSLMNPFKHPKVFFQFISHRVLRWSITPFALLALIPLNIIILMMECSTLYTVIAVLQALFYAAALGGWLMALSGRKNKLLYIPYYFLFMNLNVFYGIRYLASHRTSGTWEKAKRG
ncbi:MAG: glycosyltransferase family 2 protein [Prevotella sp.]|nr:glycosyltransferase family 2 protein [Prevotella sp.]